MNPKQQSTTINLPNINQQSIVQCFKNIHSPQSTDQMRRQANIYLFEAQKNLVQLMRILVIIFDNPQNYNISIRFQALLLLSNIIKRNWNNKRHIKIYKDLAQMKKAISKKIIQQLPIADHTFINTLYDITKFIAKADYPHSFQQFTQFQIALIENLNIDDIQFLKHFKQLKDIYLQLGQRKGFVNIKNFQQSLRRVVNGMGSISQSCRNIIQNYNGGNNKTLCKISKYSDQIMICIMRMAPYCLLDDQSFMMIPSHISMKLSNLLTIHNEVKDQIQPKKNIQKSIKSIIYGLGCLQTTNPCCLANILSNYITILFSIISRPQLFSNPNIIKYSLLSMKKLIKQFTYSAPDQLFLKSVSSQPKSNNYLQLRNLAHNAYLQFLKQQTIEGFLNFVLTNIMNMRTKQDNYSSSATYGGLDQENYTNDISFEKQLSIHISAAMVIEALLEKFTQIMLKLIYHLIQSSMKHNFTNIDVQTKINLCTVVSVIPKCCKKQIYRQQYLSHFPILQILAHIHSQGSQSSLNKRTANRLRQKFPAIISGWIDIFSNQQINQLLNVLLDYISQDPQDNENQNSNMDLLLYSCFSLNRIIMLKTNVIDCSYILNKVFPIAITIFANTDNPEILWPLINLISSLITKCQFDTSMIVSSLQGNSLQALISNDSEILIQALAQMFKNFLCVIPRQKPSLGVFQLIYHFLNTNLDKCLSSSSSSTKNSTNADKLITLWYYSIRQYPSINSNSSSLNVQIHQQCSNQYLQLFQNYYRNCLSYKKQPILIYILQEYMLLDMIYNNLENYVNIVVDFYQEGDFYADKVSATNVQEGLEEYQRVNNNSLKEDCLQLKIAALSFQITLITKYNLQQVNSQKMLGLIIRDFCSQDLFQQPEQPGRSAAIISNTLQNSLLAIVNRYILLHPDYFFNFFLHKSNINGGIQAFYQFYFKNMEFLTSRTANKINAMALISLLPSLPNQMQSSNMFTQFLFFMLKNIIPQVETQINNQYNISQQLGYNSDVPPSFNTFHNIGKVDNSPVFRFSQSVLSQRKQKIRKQSFYDQVNMKEFFKEKLGELCGKTGGNIKQLAQMLDQNDQGTGRYGISLLNICI